MAWWKFKNLLARHQWGATHSCECAGQVSCRSTAVDREGPGGHRALSRPLTSASWPLLTSSTLRIVPTYKPAFCSEKAWTCSQGPPSVLTCSGSQLSHYLRSHQAQTPRLWNMGRDCGNEGKKCTGTQRVAEPCPGPPGRDGSPALVSSICGPQGRARQLGRGHFAGILHSS